MNPHRNLVREQVPCPKCGQSFGWRGMRCEAYDPNTIDRKCGQWYTDPDQKPGIDPYARPLGTHVGH